MLIYKVVIVGLCYSFLVIASMQSMRGNLSLCIFWITTVVPLPRDDRGEYVLPRDDESGDVFLRDDESKGR